MSTPPDPVPSPGDGHRASEGSRRRRWMLGGGVAAIAAGLGAVAGWQRTAPAPAATGAVALLLDATLPDAAGRPVALAAFASRPLVVNFWATWCAPCIEEMPELSALHAELAPRGLGMVGIGLDSADKIAEFARKLPVGYPLVVAGPAGVELARQLGNPAGMLPFTVVVDRRGQVAARLLGRVDIARLRTMSTALLG